MAAPREIHFFYCNHGPYAGVCKYGDPEWPALHPVMTLDMTKNTPRFPSGYTYADHTANILKQLKEEKTMHTDDPIDESELRAMFGEYVPVKAAAVLTSWKTETEQREELRKLADQHAAEKVMAKKPQTYIVEKPLPQISFTTPPDLASMSGYEFEVLMQRIAKLRAALGGE